MPLLRDGVNFVLRYITAQPVDMDVMVTVYLAADYAGLSFLFRQFADEQEVREESSSEEMMHPDYAS